MTCNERVLRAVRAQVQFEVAEIATEVARAAAISTVVQRRVNTAAQRCESALHEVRTASSKSQINPAMVDATYRLYQLERGVLRDAQTRLADAQQREQQARTALADVRNRERSLERALRAERRKRELRQQAVQMILADDMWLQHAWSESR